MKPIVTLKMSWSLYEHKMVFEHCKNQTKTSLALNLLDELTESNFGISISLMRAGGTFQLPRWECLVSFFFFDVESIFLNKFICSD